MTSGPSSVSPVRPLRVGVQLPEVEYVARWAELREMTRLAEDIGLDSVWVGDHYLYRDHRGTLGPWEAWTQLGAIAAVTSRITIGPLVAATSFHRPGVLAKMALTVDEISGGRLVLGLGAGWNEPEYRAFDFPFDERVSRFEEAFTIVRTLLRDGRIDFAGRFHTLRDCELLPRGPRAGGPPLMVGSIGPRMLRITMPHVAAWNAWFNYYGNRPEGIPAVRTLVDDACREVGRDPADVERSVAVFLALEERPVIRDFERETSEPVRGTPQQVADTLRGFAAQGIAEVQLVIDPITASGIERLAPILEQLDRPG
jgi:alkanesulfonate monooxygenase SsuD/methylene tetrahydromethanopterin reductase-like flavin-dependent oxidoreductase (luciferase family)